MIEILFQLLPSRIFISCLLPWSVSIEKSHETRLPKVDTESAILMIICFMLEALCALNHTRGPGGRIVLAAPVDGLFMSFLAHSSQLADGALLYE